MNIKIAFLGKMHCGKTTAINKILDIAEENYHFRTIIKFAQPLYDCQAMFMFTEGKNRLFLQDMSSLAKKHFGSQILNEIFTKRVKHHEDLYLKKPSQNALILCDDVRISSEFETVKKLGFFIVGINTSDKIRKIRNPDMFVGVDHETERDVNKLMKHCNIVLDGNLEINEFKNEISTMWNTIINIEGVS